MKSLSAYPLIAELFRYPDVGYPDRVEAVRSLLEESYPDAVAPLKTFMTLLPADDVMAMQELFVRSFDIQAITTLDVGYTLFGDDYKRGELLANLNREHLAAGNDCGHELADHLPNILCLMPHLGNEELKQDLVQELLVPAITKMIGEFATERIEKKYATYKKHYKTLLDVPEGKGGSPEGKALYQFALKALLAVLEMDFDVVDQVRPVYAFEFLGQIMQENEIEKRAEDPNYNQCPVQALGKRGE